MKKTFALCLALLLSLTLLFSVSSAKVVVVNSRDWKDVYSGVMYADYKGLSSTFLNSESPDAVLKTIPKGEEILLLESSTQPFIPDFENLLKSQGYKVETKKFTHANLELVDELGLKKFIFVEESYPYNAMIVAPYAELTKSWVFIVSDDNVDDVTSKLSGAESVIAVGLFKSSIKNALAPYVSEIISTNSKFKDSVEIAKRFIAIKPTTQVLVCDGRYIEPELISGSRGLSPVLLVGPNLLPDEITEFLLDYNIKTVVIVGNQLSVVGESIRKATNRKTVVFIKFGIGHASGTQMGFSALTMFPLPTYEARLSTESVFYSPKQGRIFVRFKNDGKVGVFEFTSLTVKSGDEVVAKAADKEPQFIGGGETYTASFDVKIPGERLAENLTVILYTSYGDSPNALDKYITATGKYGPPLQLPLKIEEIKDNSKVQLVSLSYYRISKRFGVKVKNIGDVTAYVDAELPDVSVSGISQTLGYEGVEKVEPGKEAELLIPADLTDLEVKALDKQRVKVLYGENKNLLINKIDREMKVNIEEIGGGITGLITGAGSYIIGAVILVVLIVGFLFWRKRKSSTKEG